MDMTSFRSTLARIAARDEAEARLDAERLVSVFDALPKEQHSQAVDEVAALLPSLSLGISNKLLQSLGLIGVTTPALVEALEGILQGEPLLAMRWRVLLVIKALKCDDEALIKHLIPMLQHSSSIIHRSAAEALAALAPSSALASVGLSMARFDAPTKVMAIANETFQQLKVPNVSVDEYPALLAAFGEPVTVQEKLRLARQIGTSEEALLPLFEEALASDDRELLEALNDTIRVLHKRCIWCRGLRPALCDALARQLEDDSAERTRIDRILSIFRKVTLDPLHLLRFAEILVERNITKSGLDLINAEVLRQHHDLRSVLGVLRPVFLGADDTLSDDLFRRLSLTKSKEIAPFVLSLLEGEELCNNRPRQEALLRLLVDLGEPSVRWFNLMVKMLQARTPAGIDDANLIWQTLDALVFLCHKEQHLAPDAALDALLPETSELIKMLHHSIAQKTQELWGALGEAAVKEIFGIFTEEQGGPSTWAEEWFGTQGAKCASFLLKVAAQEDKRDKIDALYLLSHQVPMETWQPELLALLSASDSWVRRYTLEALATFVEAGGSIPQEAAYQEPLISCLQDEEWDVRRAAAELVSVCGWPLPYETLSVLLKDRDEVRMAGLFALASCCVEADEVAQDIRNALVDPSWQVRAVAWDVFLNGLGGGSCPKEGAQALQALAKAAIQQEHPALIKAQLRNLLPPIPPSTKSTRRPA